MALILVHAPMGDLGDLSPRAVEALAGADVVCCADAELAGRLLREAGVEPKPLVVVGGRTEPPEIPAASGVAGPAETADAPRHRKPSEVAEVLARLGRGERVAVIADAERPVTPMESRGAADLGEWLVRAATVAGHPVEVVPGPSAAIAALVVSGLATDRFVVEGLLPSEGVARTERLAALAAERRTAVVYEAPPHLGRTLAELAGVCGGDRQVAVVSELTRPGEEVWRGSLADAAAWAADRQPSADGQPSGDRRPSGEVVLVLEGAPAPAPPGDAELVAALRDQLAAGASPRDAAAAVAGRFRVPRRRAYELAVAFRRHR